MKYPAPISRILRQALPAALIAALVPGLSSCVNKTLPPCPNVFALGDVRTLEHYRPGSGHDLADLEYSAHIDGWKGSCGYERRGEDWNLTMDLTVSFTVKRGPAGAGNSSAAFSYFYAIPAFYPKPQGKWTMPVVVNFQPGRDVIQATDAPVKLTIPVKSSELIDVYTVYLGFQMSPEDLARSRQVK